MNPILASSSAPALPPRRRVVRKPVVPAIVPVHDIAHAELRNWSHWCWSGSWPHPSLWGINAAEVFDDEPGPPPNEANALRVQAIYEELPLVDQRIVQAEYPRRREYLATTRAQLAVEVAARLGVTPEHHQAVMARFRERVRKEFSR